MGLYLPHSRTLGIKRPQTLSARGPWRGAGQCRVFTRHDVAVYGIEIKPARWNNAGMSPFSVVSLHHDGKFQFGSRRFEKFGDSFIHAVRHFGRRSNQVEFIFRFDHSRFPDQGGDIHPLGLREKFAV